SQRSRGHRAEPLAHHGPTADPRRGSRTVAVARGRRNRTRLDQSVRRVRVIPCASPAHTLETGMAAPERPARPTRRRSPRAPRASHDALEARVVPAVVATAVLPPTAVAPAILISPAVSVRSTVLTPESGSSSPTGFTPQQIRAAYGISSLAFG